MGNHRERAREQREAELDALQVAIRQFITREQRDPKYRELATLTGFPLPQIKKLMWYLNVQGQGFTTMRDLLNQEGVVD